MKLVLGSKSPRRKELLTQMGFTFEIRVLDTDESFPEELPLNEVAEFVALKKADALMNSLKEDELLICADTTVICNNKLYNKPENRDEAIQMLSELSGNTHNVVTGVVVRSLRYSKQFSVATRVSFKKLSFEEITYYIDHFKPYDKAGSYGIQDWFGANCVTQISGSYTNVVGLPTAELYAVLQAIP